MKSSLDLSAVVDKSKTKNSSQFLKEACDVVSQRKTLLPISYQRWNVSSNHLYNKAMTLSHDIVAVR